MERLDIRKLRERLGWSQASLARELGVSPATVSRWERGTRQPSPQARRRLLPLWLEAGLEANAAPRPRARFPRGKANPVRVRHIAGSRYLTREFQLGSAGPGGQGDFINSVAQRQQPQRGSQGNSPEVPALPEWDGQVIGMGGSEVQPQPHPAPTRRLPDSYPQPRAAEGKRWGRLGRLPAAVKALAVAVVVLVLFAAVPLSVAGAEGGIGLTSRVPEALAKLMPNLEAFLSSVQTDLINIGQAYMRQDHNATPAPDPEESLAGLMESVRELNIELGQEPEAQGLNEKVFRFFQQTRQEAWARATQGRSPSPGTDSHTP